MAWESLYFKWRHGRYDISLHLRKITFVNINGNRNGTIRNNKYIDAKLWFFLIGHWRAKKWQSREEISKDEQQEHEKNILEQ